MLKQLVNKILISTIGFKLEQVYPPKSRFARLHAQGFHPRTVVDVGVGFGTPELYKSFPKSYHVLIEPLVEFKPYIQEILKDFNGKCFFTAVGAKKEKRIINFESSCLQKSSFYNRTASTATGNPVKKQEIQVTTLDKLLEEHSFQPPFGLKIDAEGAEFEVIKGASRFLRNTEFVIAEISVAKRFELSYLFADFINIMAQNEFHLCEILEITRGLYDKEIKYVDALFKKINSSNL